MEEIFAKVARALRPGGIVSGQCFSIYDTRTESILREILSRNFRDLKLQAVYIPSYCEEWVFMEARKID